MKLNGVIMIWHMELQWDKIPALKKFQSCHFSYILRGQERFRNITNLHNSIERAAQIKNLRKDNGRWSEHCLTKMYNSVKNLFDFDGRYGRKKGRKWFEQQIWETIYRNHKERKHLLVGEEEQ